MKHQERKVFRATAIEIFVDCLNEIDNPVFLTNGADEIRVRRLLDEGVLDERYIVSLTLNVTKKED